MTREQIQSILDDPNTPDQMREFAELALVGLGQQAGQTQAQPAFDREAMDIRTARQNLERFNAIDLRLKEYQERINQRAAPQEQAAFEAIDKRYEDQLEGAVEPEAQAALMAQINAEKEAQSAQIRKTATDALDSQLRKEGQKPISQLATERQTLAPLAQQAAQKIARLDAGDQTALGQLDRGEQAVRQQRLAKQQRDLNVLKAMEEAEAGGPEATENFIKMVESVPSAQKQQETIQLLRNLGFQSPRPIQLRDGSTIQPAGVSTLTNQATGSTTTVGSAVGGGFAQMPDGSFKVYLPNGGTATASTEEEAKAMSQAAPEVASPEQVQEAFGQKREQFRANLQNSITAEQQRLAAFMSAGEDGEGDTPPPIVDPDADNPERDLATFSLANADRVMTNARQGLWQGIKSFATGERESEEDRAARFAASREDASAKGFALGALEPAVDAVVGAFNPDTTPITDYEARERLKRTPGSQFYDPNAAPLRSKEPAGAKWIRDMFSSR
jgi:hypothetical protein